MVNAHSNENIQTDHLVIGSGIAGLMLALKLAKTGKVLVIAKSHIRDNNTFYAQGGIASVLDEQQDSFERHINDTILAGAGLCHHDVVDAVVRSGPKAIAELIDIGARFTGSDDKVHFHLTREGGHSARRVIHADDLTGQEVLRALIAKVRQNPAITVLENKMAVDLVTTDKYFPNFSKNSCIGAYVLNRETGVIFQVRSHFTYLCTGGHGKVYLYTSNPDSATGDGLAMGYRAGCKVANLEFMQFHPTCLFHPKAKRFLISEAVRGEGAILKDVRNVEFMKVYHDMGSLAPRDVVARAIDLELKKSGDANVYLDARPIGAEKIRRHFPNIHRTCLEYGIDMTRDMIPVVPAAHYSCGGLVVDINGRTDVDRLYALGESACTGLHGANRLASNSLLEALVFADRVACDVQQRLCEDDLSGIEVPDWDPGGAAAPADELVVLSHTWDEIRRLMWHYVGIVRSDSRLKRALGRIRVIREELDTFYWQYHVTDSLLEVRNLALVALLTIRCAMARKESRGIHYTIDHPGLGDQFSCKDTLLK